MATAKPPLRILAQPKAEYRERYSCEVNPRRNRAQRFIRAADNPYNCTYPTIEIPREWINELQLQFYIRISLVTVPNERVADRCVHPYPINTEDANVLEDRPTNSLYFPVTENEMQNGQKIFQFTLQKRTHYQLKNHGPLRLLDSEEQHESGLEDPTDVKKMIEIYQLEQSQLRFSIAIFPHGSQSPVTYKVSSVFSSTMTGTTTSATTDDDFSFRCSPRRGDCKGGDEILMVIPKIDKRKVFSVRFIHPAIDSRSSVHLDFVDVKTMSFLTPPCPVLLTNEHPTLSVPIVVTQSGMEVARVDFIYQSLDKCMTCNSNLMLASASSPTNNKRSLTHFENDDGVEFCNLSLHRTDTNEQIDHSRIRNCIRTARLSSSNVPQDAFTLLENAIRHGANDVALQLIEETESLLEQMNNQGQTPLLLAARFNRNELIKTILKDRPELGTQIDAHGNNLLHALASVAGNRARNTIENVLSILDDNTVKYSMAQLNNDQQTPRQVAVDHGNMQYTDLL